MKNNDDYVTVYSSEMGRIRNNRGLPIKSDNGTVSPDGYARLRREVKGRHGKTVITISGIPLENEALKELAGCLKKRCGCGGTVKHGIIEIQGDHRDLLETELRGRGYKVKLSEG